MRTARRALETAFAAACALCASTAFAQPVPSASAELPPAPPASPVAPPSSAEPAGAPSASASAAASAAASAGTSEAGAEASPQATMFAKKCGSCHTLGEGDRTGPDLLGATKRRGRTWLTSFVRSPGTAIDGGDPVANELLGKFKGVRMPDQTLTDTELDQLLAYIDECTAKGGCKLAFGKAKHAREATAAEIAAGRALFEGRVSLANGGPACMSCHNVRGAGLVGGGTLAKDLTHVYARLGEQGTTAALASTPFPLMKNVYATAALTDPEAFKVKAFLYASSRDGAAPPVDHDFFYVGVFGALVSFGAIGAAWRDRLRGVRRHVVRRGVR